MQVEVGKSEQIELVLNGDVFDFDSVMVLPQEREFPVGWLERRRGLNSEERKSEFKMRQILSDHSVFVSALADFLLKGHRLVFVIGNHDLELHWPAVQKVILDSLALEGDKREQVKFAEWFYLSNSDTLIEHGNQYDPYCLCSNPINPLIKTIHGVHVRLPFGNLAGKFMLNGMGLMNPHADASFIRGSVWDYLVYYYRYMMRTQPFLLFTWFWSALVALVVSVSEGFLPAMSDPLTIGDRIESIAQRANATPRMVLALRELHAHPAYFNPFQILRELWLDRAILFILTVFVSFQFFAFIHVFARVSVGWFIATFTLLMPAFIWYARSVQSEVEKSLQASLSAAPTAAQITGVERVINGHTHIAKNRMMGSIHYLNTGTWSPAFHDVECTQPYGRKCFAWLRPSAQARIEGKKAREAKLFEWTDSGLVEIPLE